MDTQPTSLLDYLAVLTSHLNLEKLLPTALDIALSVTGAERAFLMLAGTDGRLTTHVARNHQKQTLSETEFQGSTSIIRLVLEKQEPLLFPRLLDSEDFLNSYSIREKKLQSAICIPLWRHPTEKRKTLTGLLYMDSSSKQSPLREEHLQLTSALANHISISIENARLFEEVVRQKSQIDELNQRLQERVEAQAGKLTEVNTLLAATQRELGKTHGLAALWASRNRCCGFSRSWKRSSERMPRC